MTRYAEGNVTGLRVMPGYEATIRAETFLTEVEIWATRKRACSKGCSQHDCKHAVTRGAYAFDFDGNVDPRVALVATIIGDTLHEAMEWSTLNGEMHRDPHGNGDDLEDAVVKFVVDALS
jgi:hypothetical protein